MKSWFGDSVTVSRLMAFLEAHVLFPYCQPGPGTKEPSIQMQRWRRAGQLSVSGQGGGRCPDYKIQLAPTAPTFHATYQ